MRIGRPSIAVAGRMSNGVGLNLSEWPACMDVVAACRIDLDRLRPRDVRHPSLAGLVVLAGSLYPIPSRTRPSNFPAPMVLSLKTWKSRSLPGLPRTETSSRLRTHAMREHRGKRKSRRGIAAAAFCVLGRYSFRALFAVVPVAWKMHRGDGRSTAHALRLHRERDYREPNLPSP